MIARDFDFEKDYEMICGWWDKHGWSRIQPEQLPQSGVVIEDGNPIVACFLYNTDSTIGWIEWMVSDPDSNVHHRREAIMMAIKYLKAKAKELGLKHLFTSAHNKHLIEKFKESQFIITDENVTHMIGGVECQ